MLDNFLSVLCRKGVVDNVNCLKRETEDCSTPASAPDNSGNSRQQQNGAVPASASSVAVESPAGCSHYLPNAEHGQQQQQLENRWPMKRLRRHPKITDESVVDSGVSSCSSSFAALGDECAIAADGGYSYSSNSPPPIDQPFYRRQTFGASSTPTTSTTPPVRVLDTKGRDDFPQHAPRLRSSPLGRCYRRRCSTSATKQLKKCSAQAQERIQRILERSKREPVITNPALLPPNEALCCVCIARRASVKVYPCGHQSFCRVCGVLMIKKRIELEEDEMHCVICGRDVETLKLIKPGFIGRKHSVIAVSGTADNRLRQKQQHQQQSRFCRYWRAWRAALKALEAALSSGDEDGNDSGSSSSSSEKLSAKAPARSKASPKHV